jgi:hypothetical protein
VNRWIGRQAVVFCVRADDPIDLWIDDAGVLPGDDFAHPLLFALGQPGQEFDDWIVEEPTDFHIRSCE